MSDILGPNGEQIIANHDGLLEVVTTGKIVHDGETLTYPNGTTLIRYGDLLDFANNKKLTNKQANNVFSVMNALAKDLIAKSTTGKLVKPNYGYVKFLENVLSWRSKGDTTKPSQIGIDTTNMEFKIGNKSFPLSKIQENKKLTESVINIPITSMVKIANQTVQSYLDNLDESSKKDLFEIIKEDSTELESKFNSLKQIALEKLNPIMENEDDDETKKRLEETILKINEDKFSQINFLRLKKLTESI
jgi:hypothetical protein